MAPTAIWGYLVKIKEKAEQKFLTVQTFSETGVRKHSKFSSPTVKGM